MNDTASKWERILPRSTKTDWFIHEVRNALTVSTSGIDWSNYDYSRSRKILIRFKKNLRKNNPNICGQGGLSDDQINKFIEESISSRWDNSKVSEIKSDFDELIKQII